VILENAYNSDKVGLKSESHRFFILMIPCINILLAQSIYIYI
jgi:hypothetical protein